MNGPGEERVEILIAGAGATGLAAAVELADRGLAPVMGRAERGANMRIMADAGKLRIPFSLRGLDGHIDVSLARNTDPGSLGYLLLSGGQPVDFARDFPVCRATVTYPADGYAAIFGWTQVVRSTDSTGIGFEMDPIAIYRDIPTPYAWYGLKPELFDAPSRGARYGMDWEAHSFLCVSPDAVVTPQVQAIAGFRWGFTVTGAGTDFVPPMVLRSPAWDDHLDLLRASYPTWVFDAGYGTADPAG